MPSSKSYAHLKCGLIGEHLGHSFSPAIHEKLADYSYKLAELSPDQVGEFVKNGELDAFNVTIPYKKTVIPFLDEISPEAKVLGAVNTVVRGADGLIRGYNTDYFGFSYMLDSANLCVAGKKAVVFGRGGASATVCAVLRDRGVRELAVVGSKDNTPAFQRSHSDSEILVNASPVGMYPHNGVSPADLSLFPNCCGVLDLIYNPAKTAFLLDAEERGIPAVGGLSMLVAQAVQAFSLFTGEPLEYARCSEIVRKISEQTQNVILIGMPGCGKSTVGKLLANTLNRPFFDADEEFFVMHRQTPADVIREMGEDRFRQMEHAILCELGKKSGVVIACGGGAVTREENYRPLHQNGVIIFLERELSKLPTAGRPLSQQKTPETLYRERIDAYHRFADLEVTSTEIPEQTAKIMMEALSVYHH